MWFSSFIVDFGGSFVFVVVMGTLLCMGCCSYFYLRPHPHPTSFFSLWLATGLYFDFDVGNIPFPAIVGGVDGGEGYYGNSETHI
jgi:hypothetical protein